MEKTEPYEHPSNQGSPHSSGTQPALGARSPCTVFVVDDEEVDRWQLRRLLQLSRRFDCIVKEFSTAHDALAACRGQTPDCILLDYALPGMDGIEFIHEYATRPLGQRAPIVLLTGTSSSNIAVRAMKAGASDFVTKDDLGTDLLESVVRLAIERHTTLKLRERLERSERMALIGQLAAGVAHEVNNPASYSLISLQMAQELMQPALTLLKDHRVVDQVTLSRKQAEEVGQLLSDSIGGVERIAAVVAELRNFSNLNPRQVEHVEIDDVVRACVVLLARQLPQGYKLDLALSGPPAISADRGKLIQVVTNLLLNAVQAAATHSAESAIRVETCFNDRELSLSVEDNGPGIPEELRAQIFEPFFTTKAPGQGLGLGLALSAEYVHRHGGSITASSSQLGGARVMITLPLHTGLGALRSQAPQPSNSGKGSTATRDARPSGGLATVAPSPPGGTAEVPSPRGTSEVPSPRGTSEVPSPRGTVLSPLGGSVAVGPDLVVPATGSVSPQCILLIDDEPKILDVFQRILEREHQVAVVRSAEEAVRLIGEGRKFDLILCDVHLGDSDGFSLRERIARDRPELAARIVFCTGGGVSDATNQKLAQESVVLSKPMLATDLLRSVRQLLERASLNTQS